MTIWGTFVFAKPLGRCVERLREILPAECLPAMDRLVQTLDEYLQATDVHARDVFRKAAGFRRYAAAPDGSAPWPLSAPLSDEEMRAILAANCDLNLTDDAWQQLLKFGHAVEARVRMEQVARDA